MIALTTSVLDGALLPSEFAFLISGRPEAVGLNRAWDDFLHEWTGDPLTLTPAQRVGLLAINGWWTELAFGKDHGGAMDAETRGFIISLVSGGRLE